MTISLRDIGCVILGAIFLLPLSACSQPDEPRQESAEENLGVVDAPFRFVSNQILIDVMIGDKGPYTFLVDTGVTPSGIDSSLALKHDMPIDEENSGNAAGLGSETVKIFPTTMSGLTIAGADIEPLATVAFPFAGISKKLGEPLHGILGYEFLKKRATRIDYVNHILSFSTSAKPFENDIAASDFVTPLKFGEGDILPVVEIAIGAATIVASIDTGSSLGVEVFSDVVEKLGLTNVTEDWIQSEVTGARGTVVTLQGALPEISIGPLVFADVPASIGPRRGGDYRDANIGNRLWHGYVIVFDYVEDRVAFRKIIDANASDES